jgi:hypothetical protein
MFALRVTDSSSASIQVLFEGHEAEKFLGYTMTELSANAACRERAQRKLQACRDLGLQCEYKVKVFVSKETVVVAPAAESAPGGVSKKRQKGKNGGRAAEESYVRYARALFGYFALHLTLTRRHTAVFPAVQKTQEDDCVRRDEPGSATRSVD